MIWQVLSVAPHSFWNIRLDKFVQEVAFLTDHVPGRDPAGPRCQEITLPEKVKPPGRKIIEGEGDGSGINGQPAADRVYDQRTGAGLGNYDTGPDFRPGFRIDPDRGQDDVAFHEQTHMEQLFFTAGDKRIGPGNNQIKRYSVWKIS